MTKPALASFWPKTLAVVLLGSFAQGSGLHAQTCPAPSNNDIFNLSLCVDGQVASIGSNSLTDIIDQIDESRLQAQFPSYEGGVSAGEFRLDVRGLPVTLSYSRDSTALVFMVPSLGINESFNGATRNISRDLFED